MTNQDPQPMEVITIEGRQIPYVPIDEGKEGIFFCDARGCECRADGRAVYGWFGAEGCPNHHWQAAATALSKARQHGTDSIHCEVY